MGHFFPLAQQIRSIAAPIVADAASQLGSRANIYQLAAVRQADGSTVLETNNLPAAIVAIRLSKPSTVKLQETFGQNTNVTTKGSMSRVIPVLPDDVFEITEGDFAGQVFQVVSVINRQLSDSYLLGLVDYEGEL
jgi:hypothetical protein